MSRTAVPVRVPVPAAAAGLPVALAADLVTVVILRRWLALARTPTIAIALVVACAAWVAATALVAAVARRRDDPGAPPG